MKRILSILLTFFICVTSIFSQRDVNSVSDKLFDLRFQRKYDEAISDLNQLIETSPNDAKLYIKRAEFLGLQNKIEEAITDVSNALRIEPDNAIFYIERAKYFRLANDNKALLTNVLTAVSLIPAKQIVLVSGARELFLSGQFKENIKIADFFITRNELRYWAYKLRSENKFALKDYSGALEDSIKSIELINTEGDEDMNAFSTSIELGNLPQYETVIFPSLTKHLKNDKNLISYYNRIIDLLEIKFGELVDEHRKQHIQQKGIATVEFAQFLYTEKLKGLMLDCAEIYLENGQQKKADDLLNRLVKINPEYSSYRTRALFYKSKGKYKEAIEDLTHIIQIRQPSSTILFMRGDLYVLTKQYDKAIGDYETVISLYQQHKGIAEKANEKITSATKKRDEDQNKLN